MPKKSKELELPGMIDKHLIDGFKLIDKAHKGKRELVDTDMKYAFRFIREGIKRLALKAKCGDQSKKLKTLKRGAKRNKR